MQLFSFRIWTRVAVSISYDDDHYRTTVSSFIQNIRLWYVQPIGLAVLWMLTQMFMYIGMKLFHICKGRNKFFVCVYMFMQTLWMVSVHVLVQLIVLSRLKFFLRFNFHFFILSDSIYTWQFYLYFFITRFFLLQMSKKNQVKKKKKKRKRFFLNKGAVYNGNPLYFCRRDIY